MTDDAFVRHVVVWSDAGVRHLLEFDDAELAVRCGMQLEAQGKAEILITTQCLDVPPNWYDEARERVWQSIVAKLQADNTRLRLAQREEGELLDLYRAMKPQHEVAS